ncbi:uncharacterized protein K452DRAFT_299830 [Aplosporella prunicola CBS 121167]|uniref:Zn(2)-C6 fungal-type domain-containing protein n=1 Tax=Aplosporella prunicola CBS 121167 TaxID=1176127 RepID=A0A6A6B952_9PEZI|nr:uncharacterized protein K452DRAFT_299830 [Aplosporella prunicola CBS 121167]KAF2139845.1 hypothetical protein K452DRAFT_299830 [Aplosporella prunicola CBS 121167]
MRQDIRQCPVTRQNRNVPPPSVEPEPDTANGQPRRRIAVACARCRKRKIRCSGDPGNNTGCQNCRAAGADINQCQFNRVGSFAPTGPVYNYPNAVASSPNLPLTNSYHGSTGSYPPHDKGILMARAYQPYSAVAYSDDSPIESYGYQTPAPLPANDVFGSFFGAPDTLRQWNTMDQKPAPTSNGMCLDQANQGSYSSAQLPYLSTPVTRQPAVTTDSMAAFSMNSLQSSLMPAMTSIPSSLETRHLPVPTATRMPSQIQTELPLRTLASSGTPSGSGIGINGSYTKAAMVWNLDNNTQDGRQSSSNGHSSELMPAPSLKSSTSSMQDPNVVSYIPITTASPDSSSSSGSGTVYTPASNTYTPGSVPLDEKFPSGVRTPPPTEPPTSSSAVREDAQSSLLSRSDSSSNLYAYSAAGSSKRGAGSSAEQAQTDGALVSGQRYAPLSQPQPQHNISIESLRRSSFEDARRRNSVGRL